MAPPFLHFYEIGTAGCAVGTGQIQRRGIEKIFSFGDTGQNDALQQSDAPGQQNFMHLHGGVFRADALTLVAQKAEGCRGENLCRFFCDG